MKDLRAQLRTLQRGQAAEAARDLAATAVDGVVVARVDGTPRDELRELALALRDRPGIRAVVLGSVPDEGGVALVSAVSKDGGLHAGELLADAARTVGRRRGQAGRRRHRRRSSPGEARRGVGPGQGRRRTLLAMSGGSR